jgi:hypothetical protein
MYIYYNMDNEIISKLQVKPIPQKDQNIKIILSNLIEDKRNEKFDETLLFKEIKSKLTVFNDKKEEIEKNVIKEDKKEEIEKEKIEKEDKLELVKKEKKIKPKLVKAQTTIPAINQVNDIEIGDEIIKERLPKEGPSVIIEKSSYFMNNREVFIRFVDSLFQPYRDELFDNKEEVSCKSRKDSKFELLTHQKIIRDYINIYTPYRGLLIFHGLGSGKTCGSIGIAEGVIRTSSIAMVESLDTDRKIIVMTPASLRKNYFEELKKCGNPIYKKKQFWEFINTEEEPENLEVLSNVLHLPVEFIRKNNGAWLVNANKESNYNKLSSKEKGMLDEQLNEMIHQKFQFINYNGLRKKRVDELTENNTKNPFSNKVVIIDEAHNFISRIVNKIEGEKDIDNSKHTFIILYKTLLQAENCKIILLSGTPIINYPNEIGILFNILRGYIKTWNINIEVSEQKTNSEIEKIIKSFKHVDYVEYNSNKLKITRNPFGFVNTYRTGEYKGVKLNKQGDFINNNEFLKELSKHLTKNKIKIKDYTIENYKALPDKLDDFNSLFIDSKDRDLKNTDIFKRRILGLTSYYRSAQEELLPDINKNEEKDYHIIKLNMSDYQFKLYKEIRIKERKQESKKKTGKLYESTNSTYKIFSRAYCNFVFPENIQRPFPKDDELTNNDNNEFDGLDLQEQVDNIKLNKEDENEKNNDYPKRIKNAIESLKSNNEEYLKDNLEKYSPKFAAILENLENEEHKGCHFLYSQFRTLEGIEILTLILEANGFKELKVIKNKNGEFIFKNTIVKDKMFSLYTGSESEEEKEIIRNIYNGDWGYLPTRLSNELKEINKDNNFGEIIKLFMITSSGAEGINLKNTRYVHITEPYWHPVRIEQVIGRARRICSHEDLPEEFQNVKVFLYLMQFTDKQIEGASAELRLDRSKYSKNNTRPLTTDEALFEIMNRKENINKQILTAIKETAMDCYIHSNENSNEKLECYSFGNENNPNIFSMKPNINDEEKDTKIKNLNLKNEQFRAVRINIDGKDYARRLDDKGKPINLLYDIDTFKQALKNPKINAKLVGKLMKNSDGNYYIDTGV